LRGPDLLRVKGFLNVTGCRGPVVVHVVQHLAHPPVELAAWPDKNHASRLVFITRNIPERQVRDLMGAVRALGGRAQLADDERPRARHSPNIQTRSRNLRVRATWSHRPQGVSDAEALRPLDEISRRPVKEAFMPIAIIGAGAVGATLGQAWLDHGQDVIWGLRNPADPKYASLAKERVKAPAEAAKEAEIVVIATPWSRPSGREKPGQPRGKIVIDCTNPLGMGPDGLQLVLGFDTSAGEQVASWAPDAFVFKTLNTTGASNMARAAEYPVKPLMLVAGDEAGKKTGGDGAGRHARV
jgi:predicted dinucleotide-binding enzyme